MALVWVSLAPVFLWFKWNPPRSPEGLFLMAGDAVHPLRRHRFMFLLLVPLAELKNVFGCSWSATQGALLDLGGFAELYRSLNPRVEVVFVLLGQSLLQVLL